MFNSDEFIGRLYQQQQVSKCPLRDESDVGSDFGLYVLKETINSSVSKSGTKSLLKILVYKNSFSPKEV